MSEVKRKFGENKEKVLRAEILDCNGRLEVVIQEPAWPMIIKRDYYPTGRVLVFPKKWGRRRGAETLVNHHIQEQEKIIKRATLFLEDLYRMKEGLDKSFPQAPADNGL